MSIQVSTCRVAQLEPLLGWLFPELPQLFPGCAGAIEGTGISTTGGLVTTGELVSGVLGAVAVVGTFGVVIVGDV